MMEAAVAKVVAIHDRSTVGDIGVVVVNHPMAVPVPAPVIPAPTKTSKESDPEPRTKVQTRTVKKDSGNRIPAWVGNDGIAVHEPRIISGNVDYIRVGRFDDDRVALICYLFPIATVQMASLLSLLPHFLHGIYYVLLLVGIGVAEG